MPKETLDAVYEDGVFRPLKTPTGLAEHRRVTLTVTAEFVPASLAELAGSMALEDAEDMRNIVEQEFEHVDPSEWQ